jgi:peptide/nickel transport system substrate-binding protein
MIGSGPFTLESYTPDVSYVYKKSPDWFEKGRPYIDGAKKVVITDPNAQIAQFSTGNLDYIQSAVNDDNLADVQKQNPAAETYTTWGPGDGQIYFPLGSDTSSPFKDIRLRRAVSLLLDRQAMTSVAFNDRAAPTFYANHSFGKWSLSMEDLPSDTAQWYKYNVQQAKQLVEAAGATKLSIKLLGPSPLPPTGEAVWFRKMREMVYNFMKVLPWEVNLILIDYTKDWMNSGKGVRYGNFPSPNDSIVWGPLEGRQDIDEYLFGWYHSKSSTNLSHLSDPKLDGMIDKARTIINEDERTKAYIDTQKYMADQMFSVAGNPGGLSYFVLRPRLRNWTSGDTYGVGTAAYPQLWLQK